MHTLVIIAVAYLTTPAAPGRPASINMISATSQQISGFTSLAACQAAGSQFVKTPSVYYEVRCVPVAASQP